MHPSYYRRPLFIFLLLYMAFLAAFPRYAMRRGRAADDVAGLSGQTCPVTGTVTSFPRRSGDKTYFTLSAVSACGRKVSGNISVSAPVSFEPRWRSVVTSSGAVSIPPAGFVPGNLDWRQYLETRSVFCEQAASLVRPQKTPPMWARAVTALRQKVLDALYLTGQRNGAVAAAVVLGEKEGITGEVSDTFRDSGAMHLLVASGSNVGFVTVLVFWLCRFLPLRRGTRLLAAVFAAGLYTLCAGADPPLTRAYLMYCCAAAGYFFGRESGVFQGLVVAAACLLLWTPAVFFRADFQLSFAASAALVLAAASYTLPRGALARFFAGLFLVSAAAQLALLPLLINAFHRVSLISFVSNMVLVPFSAVVMGAGFLLGAVSFLKIGFLTALCVKICAVIVGLFIKCAEFFAALPFSNIAAASWTGWFIGLYYSALFVVLNGTVRLPKKLCAASAACAAVFLLYGIVSPRSGECTVFRYGGKNCALIKTPSGQVILSEAGIPGDKLANAVLSRGAGHVEAIFLSSREAASYAGVPDLLARIGVKNIYVPAALYGSEPPDFGGSVHVTPVHAGDEIKLKDVSCRAVWGADGLRPVQGLSGWDFSDRLAYACHAGKTNFTLYGSYVNINSIYRETPVQFDIIPRRAANARFSFGSEAINAVSL